MHSAYNRLFNLLWEQLYYNTEFNDDFDELNVLLGTKRIYEDRVNSMVWIPEQEYAQGSWGYIGGKPYRAKTKFGSLPSSELNIKGSQDDPIYQTQRVGINGFKLDVPNGKYSSVFVSTVVKPDAIICISSVTAIPVRLLP